MASANRRPSYEEDSSDSDGEITPQGNRRKRAILKRPQRCVLAANLCLLCDMYALECQLLLSLVLAVGERFCQGTIWMFPCTSIHIANKVDYIVYKIKFWWTCQLTKQCTSIFHRKRIDCERQIYWSCPIKVLE